MQTLTGHAAPCGEDNASKEDFILESRLGISKNTGNLIEDGLE